MADIPETQGEEVNYAIRPAKHVERKMMVEAFRKLSEFTPIEDYRYIGFGAIYFSDFQLIHKQLGITKMFSIEQKSNHKRYIFNRPYSCIRMRFGKSIELLPKFAWEVKTILWLDYTQGLNLEFLADVIHFCTYGSSGSMIIVSVNGEPERFAPRLQGQALVEAEQKSLENFIQRFGEERLSSGLTGGDLRKWGTAKEYRNILHRTILSTLKDRNGSLASDYQIQYRQLFNFHYADNAKMLTVGGILYENRDKDIVSRCRFEALNFIRGDEQAFEIKIPNLTYRELRHLDKYLPSGNFSSLTSLGIPKEDLERYSQLYRYFPSFADVDI